MLGVSDPFWGGICKIWSRGSAQVHSWQERTQYWRFIRGKQSWVHPCATATDAASASPVSFGVPWTRSALFPKCSFGFFHKRHGFDVILDRKWLNPEQQQHWNVHFGFWTRIPFDPKNLGEGRKRWKPSSASCSMAQTWLPWLTGSPFLPVQSPDQLYTLFPWLTAVTLWLCFLWVQTDFWPSPWLCSFNITAPGSFFLEELHTVSGFR